VRNAGGQKMAKTIYWFRNDLRLHDQPALQKLKDCDSLLPVYIVDERLFKKNSLGFASIGPFRIQFLLETLQNLKLNLKALGSNLLVFIGKSTEIFQKINKMYAFSAILAQKEHTAYEVKDEEDIEHFFPDKLKLHEGLTLINPKKVSFSIDQLPHVFTSFRKKVEKSGCIDDLTQRVTILPKLPQITLADNLADERLSVNEEIDDRTAFPFKGGESNGLQHLENYIWKKQLLVTYKETRNGLVGANYSSKLSPWLANGSLSPKRVYYEVKRFEQQVVKNSSTYWLIFELLWRDFFRFTAIKHGKSLFLKQGIGEVWDRKYTENLKWFNKWKNGETGQPFVDANMKELLLTGFMSNRGRQNVASYLCNDLKMDWTWGAKWFENRLVDYDPCSNYGNWQYIAGVGNDPRKDRYFNLAKQAERYDPENKYQQLWLN